MDPAPLLAHHHQHSDDATGRGATGSAADAAGARGGGLGSPEWFTRRLRWCCTALGCFTFLTTTSVLPVWNKILWSVKIGADEAEGFHFPLFTTTVYLAFCFLGGVIYFGVLIAAKSLTRGADVGEASGSGFSDASSCYLRSAQWWKKQVVATCPIGLAFGIKLGLTNYGLDLVSVDYHVLFQATAIVWVVIVGYILLGEIPSRTAFVLIGLMVIGELLLSLQFTREEHEHANSALGIAINLISPILEGLCVVLMRFAAIKLFPNWFTEVAHPNEEGGNKPQDARGHNHHTSLRVHESMEAHTQAFGYHRDSVMAFATIKLLFSALACAPFAILKEGVFTDHTFVDAFRHSGHRLDLIVFLLLGGSLITFLLQTSLVLVSALSLALSVGVLGLIKVVPQLAAGLIFGVKQFQTTPMHITGIILILGTSVAYAFVKHMR